MRRFNWLYRAVGVVLSGILKASSAASRSAEIIYDFMIFRPSSLQKPIVGGLVVNSKPKSDRAAYDFRLWHRFCRGQESQFECCPSTETPASASFTEWNPHPAAMGAARCGQLFIFVCLNERWRLESQLLSWLKLIRGTLTLLDMPFPSVR